MSSSASTPRCLTPTSTLSSERAASWSACAPRPAARPAPLPPFDLLDRHEPRRAGQQMALPAARGLRQLLPQCPGQRYAGHREQDECGPPAEGRGHQGGHADADPRADDLTDADVAVDPAALAGREEVARQRGDGRHGRRRDRAQQQAGEQQHLEGGRESARRLRDAPQHDAHGQHVHAPCLVDEDAEGDGRKGADERRHRHEQPELRGADAERRLQLRRDGADRAAVRGAQPEHEAEEDDDAPPRRPAQTVGQLV